MCGRREYNSVQIGGGGKYGAAVKSNGVAATSNSCKKGKYDKDGEINENSFGFNYMNVILAAGKMQKDTAAASQSN